MLPCLSHAGHVGPYGGVRVPLKAAASAAAAQAAVRGSLSARLPAPTIVPQPTHVGRASHPQRHHGQWQRLRRQTWSAARQGRHECWLESQRQQQQQQQLERQAQVLYGSIGDLTSQGSSFALATQLKGLRVPCSSVGGSMSATAGARWRWGGLGSGGWRGTSTACAAGSGGGSLTSFRGSSVGSVQSPLAPAAARAGFLSRRQRWQGWW